MSSSGCVSPTLLKFNVMSGCQKLSVGGASHCKVVMKISGRQRLQAIDLVKCSPLMLSQLRILEAVAKKYSDKMSVTDLESSH
eukprot:1667934-Amphidinium_carterae.1